jgi:hypothetical protein
VRPCGEKRFGAGIGQVTDGNPGQMTHTEVFLLSSREGGPLVQGGPPLRFLCRHYRVGTFLCGNLSA